MQPAPVIRKWHNAENQLNKRNVRRFLRELRTKAHHIYALLYGVPKSVCWIARYDEEGNRTKYSLLEFNSDLRNIHYCTDTLQIHFNAYFFREEWDACCPCWELSETPFCGITEFSTESGKELSVSLFEKEYPHMLAYLCREAILQNAAFGIRRETIKQYKFTRADVAVLRPQVMQINKRLNMELCNQLNFLMSLDVLQEEPRQIEQQRSKVRRPRIVRKTYIHNAGKNKQETEPIE